MAGSSGSRRTSATPIAFTVPDAAHHAGVSETMIRNAIRDGALVTEPSKVGAVRIIARAALEAWMAKPRKPRGRPPRAALAATG